METTTRTAAADLAQYEAMVDAAQRRYDEVVQASSEATQALEAAIAARLALEERSGAGEDVSAEEVAAAVADVEAAKELADERVWHARIEGAKRARDEARLEVDAFGREHFADLVAEEVVQDDPAREALQAAWEAFDAAASAYAVRVRRWHRLAPFGGLDPRDIPTVPVKGDEVEVRMRFAAGIETPTPRSIRARPDEAA
jgi:hypothetical protein